MFSVPSTLTAKEKKPVVSRKTVDAKKKSSSDLINVGQEAIDLNAKLVAAASSLVLNGEVDEANAPRSFLPTTEKGTMGFDAERLDKIFMVIKCFEEKIRRCEGGSSTQDFFDNLFELSSILLYRYFDNIIQRSIGAGKERAIVDIEVACRLFLLISSTSLQAKLEVIRTVFVYMRVFDDESYRQAKLAMELNLKQISLNKIIFSDQYFQSKAKEIGVTEQDLTQFFIVLKSNSRQLLTFVNTPLGNKIKVFLRENAFVIGTVSISIAIGVFGYLIRRGAKELTPFHLNDKDHALAERYALVLERLAGALERKDGEPGLPENLATIERAVDGFGQVLVGLLRDAQDPSKPPIRLQLWR
jgi:hypothetical protein